MGLTIFTCIQTSVWLRVVAMKALHSSAIRVLHFPVYVVLSTFPLMLVCLWCVFFSVPSNLMV